MKDTTREPGPILWLEDHPKRFRAHATRIEKETGRVVRFARSVEEAEAALAEEAFDLLIVDIILDQSHPDEGERREAGLRFAERSVEARGWTDPNAPVLLFFTGVIDHHRVQRMKALPRSRILYKPAHMDRLLEAVLDALGYGDA